MAQTHIFNFFPGSIHNSKILKTLSRFASQHKSSYLPSQSIWINKLYFDISTSKQKQCLTVDTRPINDLRRGKFRIQADNGQKQICYYNRGKSDTHFNSFLAKRKHTSPNNNISFSIVKILSKSNNLDVEYISLLHNELRNFCNGSSQNRL